MDIVSMRHSAQEDYKLESRQQQRGHEFGPKQQKHQSISHQDQYQSYKKFSQSPTPTNSSQEPISSCNLAIKKELTDQRKSHELETQNCLEPIALQKVDLHQLDPSRVDKMDEKINAIASTTSQSASETEEKDKSYIMKQDDESKTRAKEQQEKIKESQQNNNTSHQTLFKIQAPHPNPNEKVKDNNDRQSLVIKLVKIPQRDDQNKSEQSETASVAKQVVNEESSSDEVDQSNLPSNLVEEVEFSEMKNASSIEANKSDLQEDYPSISMQDNLVSNEGDEKQLKIDEPPRVDCTPSPCNEKNLPKETEIDIDKDSSSKTSAVMETTSNEPLPDIKNTNDLDDSKSPAQETEDNNNEDNNETKTMTTDQDATPAALGRNRRVRQKNRYFSDFHCMNLAKGTRARDDCETSATTGGGATNTRTSNRRSTTDSSRASSQVSGISDVVAADSPVYEVKRCRRCREQTIHESTTGCQSCVWKQAQASSKRYMSKQSKPSTSKKSKPRTSSSARSNKASKPVEKKADNLESTKCPQDIQKFQDTSGAQNISQCNLKRKAESQSGGPCKLVGQAQEDCVDGGLEQPVRVSPSPSLSGQQTSGGSSSNSSIGINEEVEDQSKTINSPSQDTAIRPDSVDGISHEKETPEQVRQSTTSSNRLETNDAKSNQGDKKKAEHTYSKSSKRSKSSSPVHDNKHISDHAAVLDNNVKIERTKTDEQNEIDSTNLDAWTAEQVAEFILSRGFTDEAEQFRSQSIDGISLLLMQRNDFTTGLKLKLGPALKLYDQVCKLKTQYFREMTTAS